MQICIVTIVSLLISVGTYAADKPAAKLSYAAEKAEEVIQDNSLLALRYPTAGGRRTHFLDIGDTEAMTASTFKELFDENNDQGLPAIVVSFSYIENGKEFCKCYDGKSIWEWLTTPYINPATLETMPPSDPVTQKVVTSSELSIFLVRTRFNTNPLQYKATFLSKGNKYKTKVNPLVTTLTSYLNQTTEDQPLVRRAKFYTTIANEYISICPNLAFKFAKFGLEGMPEQIENKTALNDIVTCKAFCLNISGDICIAKGDIIRAIEYYHDANELNDNNAFASLSNLYRQLGDDYLPCYITLLEKKAATHPHSNTLNEIYQNLAYLYKKTGNEEAAKEACQKIKALNDSVKNLFKRPRNNTPQIEDQNLHSQATKRTRENSFE